MVIAAPSVSQTASLVDESQPAIAWPPVAVHACSAARSLGS